METGTTTTATKKATKRNAILATSAIEVLCPYCGEGQPNPDNGAFPWTPEEVRANQGTRECVSCEQKFRLLAQSRVCVDPVVSPVRP